MQANSVQPTTRNYEHEQVGSSLTQYVWIGGDAYTAVAVAKKTGTGSWVVYHIFRDHLGTITHLKNGSTIDEYSFDAWGRRRDKDNWSYTLSGEPALFADRGFTGHEFLEDFNLYNMNGRLYDPILGRFLSPDPYIADPSFTQSYNRYSYVLNNPLKYNDPTGELPLWALWGIASAGNWLFGGMDNWLNKGMSFKQSFSTANNPIVFSGNYHPGSNSWSNTQVNAHRLVGAMANSEQDAHNYIAGFSGMGRNGEGPLFTSTPFDQFVGDSPLANGLATGPGWEPIVGTAGAIASEMYYSKKYGTWMGKNFKIYQQSWGGNGVTGGKLKFGRKVSTGIKIGGYGLGIWNSYNVRQQNKLGQISDSQMYMEQGSNFITTVFGIHGAAWGTGWELGRAVTNMEWYQEAKFNFWYNHWESRVGSPSLSNEALWYYFYQNYRP